MLLHFTVFKRLKNERLNGVTTTIKSSIPCHLDKCRKLIMGEGLYYWIETAKVMSKSLRFSLINYFFWL